MLPNLPPEIIGDIDLPPEIVGHIDLPPDIIADILSRLPAKSLLRFRCVSKPCCALIDSPNFIKLHLSRSIQNRSNRSLILKRIDSNESRLETVDMDSLEESVELNHPLKSDKHLTLVWGSCNGLLCMSNVKRMEYDVFWEDGVFLWNPSTKKHWKLPDPPIETLGKGGEYGFGFDSISDDYKVVKIVQSRGESGIWVYSLKSNLWRRVGDFPYHLVDEQPHCVLASGALHWCVTVKRVKPDDRHRPRVIAAFDLGTEEYRIVPQPEDIDHSYHFGVFEGCLCLLSHYFQSADCVDIWVMKEYGVKDSWTKLVSIENLKKCRLFGNLKPIACSKDGGKVLIQDQYCRFIWYDLETKIIERTRIQFWPNEIESIVCLGSLARLGDSGGSDGNNQGAQG